MGSAGAGAGNEPSRFETSKKPDSCLELGHNQNPGKSKLRDSPSQT